jgi:hypothetical protein
MIDSIGIAGISFPICHAHHSFTFLDLPGTPSPRQATQAAGYGAALDGAAVDASHTTYGQPNKSGSDVVVIALAAIA